jgi:phage baseplate assembly protein V
MEQYAKLLTRVVAIEKRLAGSFRRGKVAEVDAAAGTVRLDIGQSSGGEPYLTPAIPYAQLAGALKVHAPPSIGQQMAIMSEAGDFRQGIAFPMTWSDANLSPGDSAETNVITFGDCRFELAAGGLKITIGGVTIELTGDGLGIVGGSVSHDGKNIGSTHIHAGVTPGGGNTDVPAN